MPALQYFHVDDSSPCVPARVTGLPPVCLEHDRPVRWASELHPTVVVDVLRLAYADRTAELLKPALPFGIRDLAHYYEVHPTACTSCGALPGYQLIPQ